MISAKAARGLSQQQMRLVIAVSVRCNIDDVQARDVLDAEKWDLMEAVVSVRVAQKKARNQQPPGHSQACLA